MTAMQVLWKGMRYGLVSYETFDLANLALIKDWPATIVGRYHLEYVPEQNVCNGRLWDRKVVVLNKGVFDSVFALEKGISKARLMAYEATYRYA